MVHLVALLALAAGAAQADKSDKKEAKWLTKYKEALQIAQREGKPVVIDASRAG